MGLAPGLVAWHRVCPACGFEQSSLTPAINRDDGTLDKDEMCESLGALRRRNFTLLCDRLETDAPLSGRRLLEVGCAHGWFLEEAQRRGLICHAIEADAEQAAQAEKAGHRLIRGFFPGCLVEAGLGTERYDLIVFNDVFEHLPDVDEAMAACRVHLAGGGHLVINLPASTGVLYRLARLFCRLGRPASFERLWQMGFPSPHLSYFNSVNLARLAARHGFARRHSFSLPSVSWRGLWSRLAADRRLPAWKRTVTFAALAALAPALDLLPADIEVHVFSPE
jgi:SAM-dependent methyltransferase